MANPSKNARGEFSRTGLIPARNLSLHYCRLPPASFPLCWREHNSSTSRRFGLQIFRFVARKYKVGHEAIMSSTVVTRTNIGPLTTTFSPAPTCSSQVAQCATCNLAFRVSPCSENTSTLEAHADRNAIRHNRAQRLALVQITAHAGRRLPLVLQRRINLTMAGAFIAPASSVLPDIQVPARLLAADPKALPFNFLFSHLKPPLDVVRGKALAMPV